MQRLEDPSAPRAIIESLSGGSDASDGGAERIPFFDGDGSAALTTRRLQQHDALCERAISRPRSPIDSSAETGSAPEVEVTLQAEDARSEQSEASVFSLASFGAYHVTSPGDNISGAYRTSSGDAQLHLSMRAPVVVSTAPPGSSAFHLPPRASEAVRHEGVVGRGGHW